MKRLNVIDLYELTRFAEANYNLNSREAYDIFIDSEIIMGSFSRDVLEEPGVCELHKANEILKAFMDFRKVDDIYIKHRDAE